MALLLSCIFIPVRILWDTLRTALPMFSMYLYLKIMIAAWYNVLK